MAAFKAAARKVWYGKNGIVAGYVTHSTNLTRVVLTNAGHMSPGYRSPVSDLTGRDAPDAALTMIQNFVEGGAFNTSG